MKRVFVFVLLAAMLSSSAFASGSSLFVDVPYHISSDAVFFSGDIQPFSAVDPVSPGDTSGLKAVLLTLLGDYEGIVTEYRYQNTNGTWSYVREVTPDYVWLASAAVFLAVLWCTFRLGGSLLCRL